MRRKRAENRRMEVTGMSDDSRHDELIDLAFAVCDGTATDDQIATAEELIADDSAARLLYLQCMELHFEMDYRALGSEAADSEPPPVLFPSPSLSPLSPPFVGGPVFSYMVASVVLCMMLLSAWAYKITRVDPSPLIGQGGSGGTIDREFVVVGQVTGMKDCRWIDENEGTMVGAAVHRGRKYAFSSGLLEITYCGGARVILEGPCEYKADSDAGGRLQLGRLVARVEKKVASGQWLVASNEAAEHGSRGSESKTLATSHQPLATSSAPSPQPPAPLFAIRTPTAIVTDLGTEFGVEVDESGNTTSHVFCGSVSMQINGDGSHKAIFLRADESARVGKNEGKDGDRTISISKTDAFPKFARQLYEPLKLHDYAKMVLADKPLFYWTFDEPVGAAVEQVRSLSRQKLYPVGGARRCDHAAIGSGLVLGRAADFSGAAGVFASNRLRQARSMPGAWAIELWVQATGERAENEGQYVMNAGIGARPPDYRDNPSVIFNWPHGAERNELQLFYPERGPTHDGPILADDDWHHVIFVFYGHEKSFGVASRVDVATDGRRRTIDRGKFGSMFSLNGRLCIGAAKIDLSHAFHGRIDELAFYDMSRMTVEQIEARIDGMAQRHFAAARSGPATAGEAGDAPSNIATSILDETRDKPESNNAAIKGGKEQQLMEP